MSLSFSDLRNTNVGRCIQGFKHPLKLWSPLEWAGAMCGEAGEAANVAKKLVRFRDGMGHLNKGFTEHELNFKLMEELADVVIYADLAAAERGFSLGGAIVDKFNADSEAHCVSYWL